MAERLNALKHRYGLIDDQTFDAVRTRLTTARGLADAATDAGARAAFAAEMANHRTMFSDDELKWPAHRTFRVGHTLARTIGRYDVAPAPASMLEGEGGGEGSYSARMNVPSGRVVKKPVSRSTSRMMPQADVSRPHRREAC